MEFMHIVEAWGTGIPRIINRCNEYGLPEPVFEEFGNGFKVVLFKKVSNAPKKVSNTFEIYKALLIKAGITDKFIANINVVYDKCNIAEPFGQSNVQRWLDCSKSKATNVMNAMKKAEIICKVKGAGAGKYKFVEKIN